jgi:cell division protein FtsQ
VIRRGGQRNRPPDAPPIERDEAVPDHVLDELIAAFGSPDATAVQEVDFDDPSIDALLAPTAPLEPRPQVEVEPPPAAAERTSGAASAGPAAVDDHSATTVLLGAERRPTIRIGGDDELPDAVYLDEDAEVRLREVHSTGGDDPDELSTIVIGDVDESHPAVEQLPQRSSGAIDPRLRARRVAVGRAKGRRRLVVTGIVALVLAFIVGVIAVLASGLFAVEQVRWQGTSFTDAGVRQQIDDELLGTPVLRVDTGDIERRLEATPFVEDARVDARFPHTVDIDVRERRPVVAFRGGTDQQWRIVDRDGRVLTVIPDTPDPAAYMWVLGANPDTEVGAFADPLYAAAAQLWIAVPPEIRAITESITVDTAAGTLGMVLRRPEEAVGESTIDVRLGDPSNMPDKLARLLQIVRRGLDTTIPIDVSSQDVGVVTV